MGTGTFSTKNPGDVISSSDPNQYKTGLAEDHVPRNTSGVVTDVAGGLGTSLYRWATSYIQAIYLGVASREVLLFESGTAFRMSIGGTTKMVVGTDGIDGTYAKASSWALSMFTSAQRPTIRSYDATTAGTVSWVVPSGVQYVAVQGCGGGGGGSGAYGGGSGTGGGAGAGATLVGPLFIPVTADETLTIIVGAGGSGSNYGSPPLNGGTGGISYLYRGATRLFLAPGGPGGSAPAASGTVAAPGGTGATVFWQGANGGQGGRGNPSGDGTAGTAGADQTYVQGYTGGSPGNGAIGGGGGGGGGGAGPYGNGGAGGSAGNTGAAGTAGSGQGSGGGGGGGSKDGGSGGTGVGGAGGNGAPGRITITWVGAST